MSIRYIVLAKFETILVKELKNILKEQSIEQNFRH